MNGPWITNVNWKLQGSKIIETLSSKYKVDDHWPIPLMWVTVRRGRGLVDEHWPMSLMSYCIQIVPQVHIGHVVFKDKSHDNVIWFSIFGNGVLWHNNNHSWDMITLYSILHKSLQAYFETCDWVCSIPPALSSMHQHSYLPKHQIPALFSTGHKIVHIVRVSLSS